MAYRKAGKRDAGALGGEAANSMDNRPHATMRSIIHANTRCQLLSQRSASVFHTCSSSFLFPFVGLGVLGIVAVLKACILLCYSTHCAMTLE